MVIRISGDALGMIAIILAGVVFAVGLLWLLNRLEEKRFAKQRKAWRKEDEAYIREMEDRLTRIRNLPISEDQKEFDSREP